MQKTIILIFFFWFGGLLHSQNVSGEIQVIQDDWKQYTTFQKKELLSFCDFLFEEEWYERSNLCYFRYLFLFPEDSLLPQLYYKIALGYDYLYDTEHALEYFDFVKRNSKPTSEEYQSAELRIAYLHLLKGDFGKFYESTEGRNNPYYHVFRGYAKLIELKWQAAEKEFLNAQKDFIMKDHEEQLKELIEACKNQSELPYRDKTKSIAFSIIPGGGRLYEKDWVAFSGTLVSSILAGIDIYMSQNFFLPRLLPAIAIAGVYSSSIIGTMRDITRSNRQLEEEYRKSILEKIPLEQFLTFPEPGPLTE